MLNARLLQLLIKFILLCSISFFLGCVSVGTSPEFQQLSKISDKICNVAVFPFVNDTKYSQGGVIFYRVFNSQLIKKTSFNVIQEGDVRKVFRQLKIPPVDTANLEQTIIVADRLGLDAVIVGKVIIMEEKHGGLETEPELAVEVKMLDGDTGNTILTSYKHKWGNDYRKVMHFGLVNNTTELASLVAEEIISKWQENGVKGCD